MTTTATPARTGSDLYRAWQALKAEKPIRNRDASQRLGVSEAALIDSAAGQGVTRLRGDVREIVRRAPTLGHVMALTRNHACVHEREGQYEKVEADAMVGLVLGPDIDLRLFFAHWKHAFAVAETTQRGTLRSLQVYDAFGDAVHKIYLREQSDLAAYERIVAELADPAPAPLAFDPLPQPKTEKADAEVDVRGFQDGWRALKDTHEFFGLLRRHSISRMQAMRLAPDGHVHAAGTDAGQRLLEAAAARQVPIMVFVGNRGCIQIHSGPVTRIRPLDKWINVLDPLFNLHLDQSEVAESFVVFKPTSDGVVTSVELFDASGEMIVQFFGMRKPGIPERQDWRDLVADVFPAPRNA